MFAYSVIRTGGQSGLLSVCSTDQIEFSLSAFIKVQLKTNACHRLTPGFLLLLLAASAVACFGRYCGISL